jgi:hypothetical protein
MAMGMQIVEYFASSLPWLETYKKSQEMGWRIAAEGLIFLSLLCKNKLKRLKESTSKEQNIPRGKRSN